jgi:hypothetical protein
MSDTRNIDGLLGYLSLCVENRHPLMPKCVASDYYAALTALVAQRDALAAEVAALKKPDPLADYQEQVAAIVHAAMRFERANVTPRWQAGNSHAEHRARQAATEIASMLRCALKAHDPLAEITIDDITDEHVEAVEDLIGMGRGAWDMVKHRELLLACVQVIGKAMERR